MSSFQILNETDVKLFEVDTITAERFEIADGNLFFFRNSIHPCAAYRAGTWTRVVSECTAEETQPTTQDGPAGSDKSDS